MASSELAITKTLDMESPAVIYLVRDSCWQAVVPPNYWQQAQPLAASESPAGYALVACVVVPGFDLADFEISAT